MIICLIGEGKRELRKGKGSLTIFGLYCESVSNNYNSDPAVI
jgi:hypothetical protein